MRTTFVRFLLQFALLQLLAACSAATASAQLQAELHDAGSEPATDLVAALVILPFVALITIRTRFNLEA